MKKSKKVSTTLTRKRLIYSLLAICMVFMTSCEVVRTITNTAETRQTENGELIIQTKTIESYHGSKK